MKRQLIVSQDGSHTYYIPEFQEYYHSVYGAIRESRHIFILNGLQTITTSPVRILEIGLGTGLNALLTWQYAQDHRLKVYYTGIEKFPLSNRETGVLNYSALLGLSPRIFTEFHQSPWNQHITTNPFFNWIKLKTDLVTFEPSERYDLIYFDAFAPEVQPELWTETIFRRLYLCLTKGGKLVTYSAKGSVRRALKSAGFVVQKLPGPPGKREITCATEQTISSDYRSL
ncbi:MAG: tRNA (5-methylaminomethyl-2-thiouridine)(34)-methyltransferase MnmD [Bacteroidales bacterium]|nr:tRNA (5-methylaminomethyl-2-thiouridine)(34)-methyltransferase MnmD [Bacteroidales bacterium]